MNTTRTFGVEIECGYDEEGYSCSCRCECNDLMCSYCRYGCEESLGEDEECSCSCECEECFFCYNGCDGECEDYTPLGCVAAANLLAHNGFNHWLGYIHLDGSGVEIPSPVLCGREGLAELREVMGLLDRNGFYATAEDGLHVHHHAPEWVEDESLVAHTVELWEENLPMIHNFVSCDRINNSYCTSRKFSNQWDTFKETKNLDSMGGKFQSLNIDHLNSLGTLEMRLHQGTLNFEKAAAWIHFGQSFLEFSKRTYKRGEVVTCASAIELLRRSRTSPKSTRLLFTKAAA